MLKKSSLLIYSFLSAICCFSINDAQTTGPSYSTIDKERKKDNATLGSLIDSNPHYKNPTLKSCLTTALGKPKNEKISAVTAAEIIQFFEDQDLVKHVSKPAIIADGQIKTFNSTYGVEFPQHGPLEEKTITLIKTLAQQGAITFLDIGAGYGAFVKRVLEACKEDSDKMTVYINECLSVQCYYAAKLFKDEQRVLFYPSDILSALDYYTIDRTFNISTIFNVHHFMKPDDFKKSIKTVYKITKNGGYHIAIALSPYYCGDDSIIAKEHDHRIAQNAPNPGYFTEDDMIRMKITSIRAPALFLSQAIYEKAFQAAGFIVEDAGYFSTKTIPRKFSYVIAKKR